LEQRKLFAKWDGALHTSQTGPFFLRDTAIAEIVANSIRYHAGDWFDLEAFCLMPNHVHIVLTPFESSETADYGPVKIMHNIKQNSAKQANAIQRRTGGFWQHESYDHTSSATIPSWNGYQIRAAQPGQGRACKRLEPMEIGLLQISPIFTAKSAKNAKKSSKTSRSLRASQFNY
jgi:hypothetical protein